MKKAALMLFGTLAFGLTIGAYAAPKKPMAKRMTMRKPMAHRMMMRHKPMSCAQLSWMVVRRNEPKASHAKQVATVRQCLGVLMLAKEDKLGHRKLTPMEQKCVAAYHRMMGSHPMMSHHKMMGHMMMGHMKMPMKSKAHKK